MQTQSQTDSYRRLAKQIVSQKVIPFIGAGFSYGATHETDITFKSHPTQMVRILTEKIEGYLHPTSAAQSTATTTLKNNFVKCKDNLPWLAELAVLIYGSEQVVDFLRIRDYADLRPLRSHRYLAYLIFEGFISEVITTNYDCCLEKAIDEINSARKNNEKKM